MLDVKNMSQLEKVSAMEALWESLSADESSFALPEWHGEILEDRHDKLQSGTAELRSFESVRERGAG